MFSRLAVRHFDFSVKVSNPDIYVCGADPILSRYIFDKHPRYPFRTHIGNASVVNKRLLLRFLWWIDPPEIVRPTVGAVAVQMLKELSGLS